MKASPPQQDIIDSTQEINLFLAGQGSGKTHCAGMISKSFIDHFPHVRGMIAANTYGQLTRSTLFRIREFWKQCGMHEYREEKGDYTIGKIPPTHFNTESHNYHSYDNIISFKNGCVIYIGSLDNYKSLDGMEVAWTILDETKDTREEAIKEVILGRTRQPGIFISDTNKKTKREDISVRPFNPIYVFTSPAKVPWISEWFKLDDHETEIMSKIYVDGDYFKKVFSDKLVTISSVYMNEENLPDNWIERQKNNLPSHLHDMLIYGSPFSAQGGEFYKGFRRERHIKETLYDENEPLHITFDFNVNPYMTLVITQIEKTDTYTKLRIIDEICLSNPDNTTGATCRKFQSRYIAHRAGVFVYGDPSGKAQDTRSELGHNDFKIIENALKKFYPKTRVAPAAPPVVARADFINLIFEADYEGIQIIIDPKCKNVIADYTHLQEDSDGKKLKKKVKDPVSGISSELYGHTSDSLDYMICEFFKSEFRKFQRGTTNIDYTVGKKSSFKY